MTPGSGPGATPPPGPTAPAARDPRKLVPPRDPAALAGVLADRGALERLGPAARATAERHFSWRQCADATLAAYRDTLA